MCRTEIKSLRVSDETLVGEIKIENKQQTFGTFGTPTITATITGRTTIITGSLTGAREPPTEFARFTLEFGTRSVDQLRAILLQNVAERRREVV
jgi:hypothetical protein